MPTPEQQPTIEITLNPGDQAWLDNFGVDPSWQDNPDEISRVNEIIRAGSVWLNAGDHKNRELYEPVIQAREEFLDFINLSKSFTHNFLRPPRPINFVQSQRIMHAAGLNGYNIVTNARHAASLSPEAVQDRLDNFENLGLDPTNMLFRHPALITRSPYAIQSKMTRFSLMGLDPIKIVKYNPGILAFSTKTIQQKLEGLAQLGLVSVTKAVNQMPQLLGYKSDSLHEKMAHFDRLGLDSAKIINRQPSILALSADVVQQKLDFLESIGLDVVKTINRQPQLLGSSIETIKSKIDCFQQLGLDPVKLANRSPAILNFSIDTVQKKVSLITKSIKALQWEHTAKELLESSPQLLGFNINKLAIMFRIAAKNINASERSAGPQKLATAIIRPLEKSLIAIHQSGPDRTYTLKEMYSKIERIKLDADERRARALEIAPELGTIGAMYIKYRANK